ncbi:MAG: cyclic nucleotide-binding domain-containing protein [Pseudomonadota bacterium]
MMSIAETLEGLRDCAIFRSVDAAALKLAVLTGEQLRYYGDEVLFRQDEPGDSVFILLAGRVEVVRQDEDAGEERLIVHLARGDLVGELSLLCNAPRNATVRALEPVTALRIPRQTFLSLLSDRPEIALALCNLLAMRLRRTTEQF